MPSPFPRRLPSFSARRRSMVTLTSEMAPAIGYLTTRIKHASHHTTKPRYHAGAFVRHETGNMTHKRSCGYLVAHNFFAR